MSILFFLVSFDSSHLFLGWRSGDQWRHSKMIQLVRKGHIVYESDDFSLLDSLQTNISSKLEEQAKKELGNEAWEELADGLPGQTCDQEGCTAEPTNTYRMKAHFDQARGARGIFFGALS